MIGTFASRSRPRLVIGAVLVALLGCAAEQPVGLGVALSGSFVDAARLAIADAAAEGGLPTLDTVLVGEAGSRAGPALEVADRFRRVAGMAAVVAHSNSASSLATAPVYNESGIVQLAPTSTAVSYSLAGPYSFRLVPPDPAQGEVLARAIDSLHPAGARVAILYVNDDYGRGIRGSLLAHLEPTRFPVVHDQPHADEEFDLPPAERLHRANAVIDGLLDHAPDVIVWLGRARTLTVYLGPLRARETTATIIGGDGLSSWHRFATSRGDWDGVRYVDFLDTAAPGLAAFRSRFRDRFGRDAGTGEILSYDATRLLLAALRDGARTGDEVRRWLEGLGRDREAFPGLSGPIAFDASGDVTRDFVVITIDRSDR